MESLRRKEILEHGCDVVPFAHRLRHAETFPLCSQGIDILQINVGKRCNMHCKHCHVEGDAGRAEVMSREVLAKCLDIVKEYAIGTIDITGGAPEMNPHLRWFLREAAGLERRLIVRTNLTILLEPDYRNFLDLYPELRVELVASLPDCRPQRTDRLRGPKTFDRSITVLRELNARGYAASDTGLVLDLMHNPAGAWLPACQTALEQEYRRVLRTEHDVGFTRLFCLTNCPVGRYLDYLVPLDDVAQNHGVEILAQHRLLHRGRGARHDRIGAPLQILVEQAQDSSLVGGRTGLVAHAMEQEELAKIQGVHE